MRGVTLPAKAIPERPPSKCLASVKNRLQIVMFPSASRILNPLLGHNMARLCTICTPELAVQFSIGDR